MLISFISSLILTICMFGASALAQESGHSQNVCSAKSSQICAHLGYLTALNTKTEAQFYVHVMGSPNEEIRDLKVDLWMEMGNGHGHGSAPVQWSKVGPNKYKVQNAHFVMAGTWQVRVSFMLGNEAHQIRIPVQVKE